MFNGTAELVLADTVGVEAFETREVGTTRAALV
jgi:hypothetical protein